jgi:membrane-associated protease RseP (regulator of RpoE activity)
VLVLLAAKTVPVGDPLAFYEVAATVIPVVFLGVIYEAKILERIATRYLFTAVNIGCAIGMLGEAAALKVLMERRPRAVAEHAVATSLLLLGVLLIAQPLLKACDPYDVIWEQEMSAREMETGVRPRLAAFRPRHVVVAMIVGIGGYSCLGTAGLT